jgi:hypothetical protein
MAKKTDKASVVDPVEANAPADESAKDNAPDAEPTSDDSLVEVAYHDGSAFTFDLLYAGRRIAFIDGVARVPQALADDLRAKGYVK